MRVEIDTTMIVTRAEQARPYLTWLRGEHPTNLHLLDTDPLSTLAGTTTVAVVGGR